MLRSLNDDPRLNASTPAPLDATSYLRALASGPHRTIEVGASRIATWSFGAGPDLVFVHGWPLHAATFRAILPTFAAQFRCHVLDLPGVGRTRTEPGAPVSLTGHAAALRGVVDALALDRFALLGHDSGGVVARLVAADLGPRVTAMVIGNSEISGYRAWQVRAYVAMTKIPLGERLLRWALRWRAIQHASLAYGGCFRDPSFADREFGELFHRPLLEDDAAWSGQMRLARDFDWTPVDTMAATHARITAPTRLVWGADDPYFPYHLARALPAEFAGPADIVKIDGAKLFAHEDHPALFVERALPFLTRHAHAPARSSAQLGGAHACGIAVR